MLVVVCAKAVPLHVCLSFVERVEYVRATTYEVFGACRLCIEHCRRLSIAVLFVTTIKILKCTRQAVAQSANAPSHRCTHARLPHSDCTHAQSDTPHSDTNTTLTPVAGSIPARGPQRCQPTSLPSVARECKLRFFCVLMLRSAKSEEISTLHHGQVEALQATATRGGPSCL